MTTEKVSAQEFLELIGKIAEVFASHRIDAVIVGGAAVSIYTGNQNDSSDVDFVSRSEMKRISAALSEIGFLRSDSKNFTRSGSRLSIELAGTFPMIGETHVESPAIISPSGTPIRIFSPTQAVMDRLSHYYHWKDRQALGHAVEVAIRQPVNLKEVSVWSGKEGRSDGYQDFLDELKRRKAKNRRRSPDSRRRPSYRAGSRR